MGKLVVQADMTIRGKTPDQLARMVREVEPEACREAMSELQTMLGERIQSQNIGGPPLSKASVEIKQNILRAQGLPMANADRKWALFDKTLTEAQILTTAQTYGAKAELITPTTPDPLDHYRTLEIILGMEEGGVNERGQPIQKRPLIKPTINEGKDRILDSFMAVVKRRLPGGG